MIWFKVEKFDLTVCVSYEEYTILECEWMLWVVRLEEGYESLMLYTW